MTRQANTGKPATPDTSVALREDQAIEELLPIEKVIQSLDSSSSEEAWWSAVKVHFVCDRAARPLSVLFHDWQKRGFPATYNELEAISLEEGWPKQRSEIWQQIGKEQLRRFVDFEIEDAIGIQKQVAGIRATILEFLTPVVMMDIDGDISLQPKIKFKSYESAVKSFIDLVKFEESVRQKAVEVLGPGSVNDKDKTKSQLQPHHYRAAAKAMMKQTRNKEEK